jgi:hypothetical protein
VTGKETICFASPGSRRRKVVLVLACWLIEGIVWISIYGGSGSMTVPRSMERGPQPPVPAARETGAFSVRRFDPAAGHRPVFSVSWKNLRAENGRVGVFRTALSRTLAVDGLRIRSYQYSRVAEGGQGRSPLIQTIACLDDRLKQDFAGMKIEGPLADLGRATRVTVKDLDYSVLRDGQPSLDIQCRSAIVSSPGLEIVLRGGVTIKAGGVTLASNCALWDAQTNQFRIPGAYTLNDNGIVVSGRGIRCDEHLSPIVAAETYDTKGAGTWVEGRSF